MLRLSVIGTGRIARAHAEALRYISGADLFGAYDINRESLRAFCEEYECEQYLDDIDMIRRSDFVIICTPNDSHFQYASKALIFGKTVICEKPLTSKLSDGIVLKGLNEASAGKIYVSFNYRHNQVIKRILNDVKTGTIGKVDHVKLEFLKGSMLTKKSIGWREKGDKENTSGAMSDLGAHLLDLCQLIIGHDIDIADMRCKLNTAVPSISGEAVRVDDNSYMYTRTKGGEFIEVHTSKVERYREHGIYIEITGSCGRLSYQTGMKASYKRRVGERETDVSIEGHPILNDPDGEIYGWSDSFLHQLKDIIELEGVSTGSIDDGLKVQTIISALSEKYQEFSVATKNELAGRSVAMVETNLDR